MQRTEPAQRDDLGAKWTSPEGIVTYLSAKYYVTGYAGPKHQVVLAGRCKVGAFLLTTRNLGSTKDTKVACWKERMMRGEVSRVDVSLNGRIVESYILDGDVIRVKTV